MEEEMLYCVGCGGAVARSIPGHTLAISCRCGALAPILVSADGTSFAPPFSIVRALRGELRASAVAHLEYWLGHSDHESPAKNQLTDLLRKAGATSQAECDREGCRLEYVRGKNEWAELSKRFEKRHGPPA